MSTQLRIRTVLAMVPAIAVVLTACGGQPENATSEAPTASTSAVEPITATEVLGPVEDPGVGATYHYQGAESGIYGGTTITVAVTNNNDQPLSPDALGEPTLRVDDGSGMKEVDLLDISVPEGQTPLHVPLELPLGVGATTNLKYTFDVSRGELAKAEFTVGNVTYSGNLAI
ncbi:hypothetical protein [Corynebacterium uterequi]|uniref:Secreted protein n=1 Tax=Corynebacterium uterequi TaxID=1072256 RepID=A0A0G3HFQ0_9CORY|nr:hypothetical protein [Corynebacterium uterequi]AKK11595.1 hypothetical protein CUTER_08050 [Corynebacterium uterequi]